jgi:2,3-bisphosphoglycerate-independent phosphoglycerate mutase
MHNTPKILFVFVDGLGIGNEGPEKNPITAERFPVLTKLLKNSVPLDTCLGVAGLPQSATGQAALLTGVNAPQIMGRHIEGFPPPALKKLIEEESLFLKLGKIGKRCTFANCYWNVDPQHIPPRRQSVTTVMTLSALGGVRGSAKLEQERALAHDITREALHDRGYPGEEIMPQEAAAHLVGIAEENDFTLFEYFLTDRAGHSGDHSEVVRCLNILEQFLAETVHLAERSNLLFLLSSDHGNIEDLSVRSHTKNPVPLVALGPVADAFSECTNLCDVAPAILRLYGS